MGHPKIPWAEDKEEKRSPRDKEHWAVPQGCDKGPSVIPSVTMLEKWKNPTVHAEGQSSRECVKRDLVEGGGPAPPGVDLHTQ